MQNLSTYLPDTSTAELKPFFEAIVWDSLEGAVSCRVREVAEELEGVTEEMIQTDISNLMVVISGFYSEQ